MSGQLTPEYRTLRINWPDVNKAISRGVDIHGYAERLHAANLTQDVEVDVQGVRRSAIVHELSGNVAIQVHLEATKFDNYVRILESYSILSSVVQKLWHDRKWYREHPEAPMDAVPPPPPPLPSPPLRSTPPPPIRDVMQEERGMAAKPGRPDPDVLLNKHDLKSLVRILRGAAHLYNELAIHLGMDADWVKNVESNTPTVQKRLIEVLSHFIGNDEHPTRRKIADALRDVDQRGLALEILGDELPGSGGDDRRRPLFNSSSHPQVPDEHQPKIHEPPPDTVAEHSRPSPAFPSSQKSVSMQRSLPDKTIHSLHPATSGEGENEPVFSPEDSLQYQDLILRLSDEMYERDVAKLRYLHQKELPTDRDKPMTALEALHTLEIKGIFSQQNITPLVDLFRRINRLDLARDCTTFCTEHSRPSPAFPSSQKSVSTQRSLPDKTIHSLQPVTIRVCPQHQTLKDYEEKISPAKRGFVVSTPTQIANIAEKIETWESISHLLEISHAKAEEIKKNNTDYLEQKKRAIKMWSESLGHEATYVALMRIFYKCKNITMVEELLEQLNALPTL